MQNAYAREATHTAARQIDLEERQVGLQRQQVELELWRLEMNERESERHHMLEVPRFPAQQLMPAPPRTRRT
ncbi:hypothetical protein [Streptomyces sp. NPDC007905]|uniref:hypothetical protein n=1 Tax=Streptomyces sp. NPDC007905 TaxID=3364788 RepID=UPI0036EC35B3